MGIYKGSLWCPQSRKMLQIDGLVWQPSFGPPLLREGNFLLLHPKTVGAVVEIKTSVNNHELREFHNRLKDIWQNYLNPYGHFIKNVIGIVLSHPNPKEASSPKWNLVRGEKAELYKRTACFPIYILFKKIDDFTYEPYDPAIREMLFRFNFIANTRRINTLI